MQTSDVLLSEGNRVQDLINRYQSEGYKVLVEPSPEELPEFLRYFHPDLIASRPDRSVAVEVRVQEKVRRSDYWREFANAIRSQPDWHLEVLTNTQDERGGDSLSPAEIEERIRQSRILAEQGEVVASLLLAWTAVEAAMRLTAERFNIRVSDLGVPALSSRLLSEGFLDREDYEFLLTFSHQRNAVAHGFRQAVTINDLAKLWTVIQTLLTE